MHLARVPPLDVADAVSLVLGIDGGESSDREVDISRSTARRAHVGYDSSGAGPIIQVLDLYGPAAVGSICVSRSVQGNYMSAVRVDFAACSGITVLSVPSADSCKGLAITATAA